ARARPDDPADALAARGRALAVLAAIEKDQPGDPNVRGAMSDTQEAIGRLHLGARHWAEAQEPFRRCLELRERLAAESPLEPSNRTNEITAHELLAEALAGAGEYDRAEAEYRAAADRHGRLIRESPQAVRQTVLRTAAWIALGNMEKTNRSRPDAALGWYQKA